MLLAPFFFSEALPLEVFLEVWAAAVGVEVGVGDDLPLPERLALFWESEYVDAVVAPLMLGMAGVLASPWTAKQRNLFEKKLSLPCKADSAG